MIVTEARATRQKASKGYGPMGVDEWSGEVLLAWVDVERRVKEGEEARAGGDAGIISRGIW